MSPIRHVRTFTRDAAAVLNCTDSPSHPQLACNSSGCLAAGDPVLHAARIASRGPACRHIKTEQPRSVYDALLLPALNYAERDRLEARLSVDEETAVIDGTRELLSDAAEAIRRLSPQLSAPPDDRPLPGPRKPLRVLGLAINGVADELALGMLVHLVDDLPIAFDITAARMQASELVTLVREREFSVVCFADLPPSPPSKTRYLVKRLRAALPEVRILVGRWAPPALADESTQVLREAGANHVGATLVETREYLGGLVEIPRIPVPGTVSVGAQAA